MLNFECKNIKLEWYAHLVYVNVSTVTAGRRDRGMYTVILTQQKWLFNLYACYREKSVTSILMELIVVYQQRLTDSGCPPLICEIQFTINTFYINKHVYTSTELV